MKRKMFRISALRACILLLCLTASCQGGTSAGEPQKPEDRSTGEIKPAIVTAKYPTEDVIVAEIDVIRDGYAVDPTGTYDSTVGIQKALDDVSKAGGGTVWMPAGVYVVSETVKIPAFVTLRGDWQDPDRGNRYGTVVCVRMNPKDAESIGVFELGGSGGVIGMTVYYPDQSLKEVKEYPFAFYTKGQGVNYMLSTVKNITVINGYRGLGACVFEDNAHEQLTVENFKGTFLSCGAEVYNQSDVGTWEGVSISPKYWQNALRSKTLKAIAGQAQPTAKEIEAYVKEHAVGLKLGDLEWTEFGELKIEGCSIGIEIMPGRRIQFAGSLYDVEILGCEKGMIVHELDERWGMVVAHGIIENGVYNETIGDVKLCDVVTTGEIEGMVFPSNQGEDLDKYRIDYSESYGKPRARLYMHDADLDKSKDVSAAIQALLDTAGKGGGIVYLPAGHYRLDAPLTVPAGVELRGASSSATRDQVGMSAGTVLMCYYGDDDNSSPEDQAFITLAGKNAGINGIRIIYPENSPLNENINTTYTVRGKGKGVYMVNCGISASAYGIDFRDCDKHFIKKVTACCYYNTYLLGGKNGVLTGCLQNGTVIYRTAAEGLVNWPTVEGEIWAQLFDPITRESCRYIIVDGAVGQTVRNTFVYGCAAMITNRNSTDTFVVNIGSDNIGSHAPQIAMESGSMTVINAMRYNGYSYEYGEGRLALHNRISILEFGEETIRLP